MSNSRRKTPIASLKPQESGRWEKKNAWRIFRQRERQARGRGVDLPEYQDIRGFYWEGKLKTYRAWLGNDHPELMRK